ncbi:MAG TPA: MFS transporter [Labilithrix sp.]|nr:MFS transporter [Labilithrix sp.]
MSTLRGFLDIRPEERRNTFAAFATLLLVTTGHTLLETARDAFFLAKMPVSQLPWLYLVIVVLALGLSQIPAARANSKWGVAGSLVVGAIVTTGFWTAMHGGTAKPAVLYAVYVWTGLFGSWAMVQLWTLLGRTHTMTQAKRLYGFIGGGAVLGGVVGAILARVTISMMSPRSAVLMAAGIFLVAAPPCLLIKLPADEPAPPPRRGTEAPQPKRPMTATMGLLWENTFARRVLSIVLVSTITVTIADFLFKSQLAERFDNTRDLGSWLSVFYGVTNTVALVTQLTIAPWVFRRAGVQRALFVFPSLMLTAAAGVVASGGVLAAAVLLKGIDGALRYSIHKTSTELLLVPVPDGTRERIKPIVDLVGSRGGQAFGSVVVIALVAVGGVAARAPFLGAIVVGLTLLWIGLVVSIRSHYLDVFLETLRSGGLSGKAELPELDLGALETLFAGLNSSHDQDVLSSLELLAEQRRGRLIPALILYHPSKVVVLRALDMFTEMGRTDFVSIADRLNGHPDGEVAAAALRARTAVLPAKELLLERLGDRSPRVSVTALVALMAREWLDAEDASARLATVLEDKWWQTTAELARAVGIVAPRRGTNAALDDRFDDLLVAIDALAHTLRDAEEGALRDKDGLGPTEESALALATPEIRVRLEVARAMEARPSAKFIPALVNLLNRHELRAAARAALVGIPGALAALDQAMSTDQLPRDIRVHLPRTIALFGPGEASAVLMRHLATAREGAVRFKTIRGLVKLRRGNADLKLDASQLTRMAEKTLEHVEELRRWGTALSRGDKDAVSLRAGSDPLRAAHHLLVDLTHDKELHATQRLFLLFELMNGDPFDDIWRGLRSKDPNSHASSLELLENLVEEPLRSRVLALVGEPEPAADAPVADADAAGGELGYADAVRELLVQSSSTMRTLAEYRATELGIDIAAVRRDPLPPAPVSPLASSLGERLLETVSDLMTPERPASGANRAPA